MLSLYLSGLVSFFILGILKRTLKLCLLYKIESHNISQRVESNLSSMAEVMVTLTLDCDITAEDGSIWGVLQSLAYFDQNQEFATSIPLGIRYR